MRRYAWPALAAVMIALIAASMIWLKDYTPFGSSSAGGDLPNVALRLEGAELVGYQKGKPAWQFQARQVEVSSDRVHTTFTDIGRGIVFTDGKQTLSLSGKRLVYNMFTQDIEAIGGIKADAGEKLSIATDRMSWNAYQQRLNCPEGVTLTTEAGEGTAKSLTADLRNESIELVHAQLRIPVEEELLQ